MAMNIIKSNVSMGMIAPLALFLLNFSVVLIVYVGAFRMENGLSAVSAGDIFAVIQYVTLVMTSIMNAAFVIVMIPHAKVAANRIGEVVSAEGYDDKIPEEALEFSGNVVFDNVSFKYDGATDPAVSNVSFKIEPGQKVSVIGGTGSGKSTLVSLMLCFRMPTEGEVIYDGRSTDSLSHKTYPSFSDSATVYSILEKL
jgi:ATP-binding cassette subfamily B protein